MVSVFYWKGKPNVGDYYAIWLAEKLFGEVEWASSPELAITGSILGWKEITNRTVVWGCGMHNTGANERCHILNKSRFKAVRGKLTAQKIGLDVNKIALGDPGLLASKYYQPKVLDNRRNKYCLLCHWRDYDKLNAIYGNSIDVINMATNDVEYILDEIYSHDLVLSTSLHGLIFAHSYGVPALHVEYLMLESKDNFKFKDYYSVLDIPYEKYKLTLNVANDIKSFDTFYNKRGMYCPSNKTITKVQDDLMAHLPTITEIKNTNRVAVCAIAKNENKYIKDWVNYYLNLGVDKIYLYDNNNSSTEYVGNFISKSKLKNVEIINVNDIHEKGFQLKCYTEFYNEHKNDFDWIIYVDIDEFISGIDNIKTFLDNPKFEDYEMIRIKWKLFGDDDLVSRDMSKPIYEALTNEITNNSLSRQGKCIVRGGLDNVCVGSCHYAFRGDWNIENLETRDLTKTTTLLKECLPSGSACYSRISIQEDYTNETVFVNHYMTKTLSEFIEQKIGRGDACFDTRSIDLSYFWKLNKMTPEKMEYLKSMNLYTKTGNEVVKKCFGIISWLPDDYNNRKPRQDRLNRILKQLSSIWPNIPILIVTQNWKDFTPDQISNEIIRVDYSIGLGILKARQVLRESFLQSNFDYIIMLDDDAIIEYSDSSIPKKFMEEIDKHPNGFCFIHGENSPYHPYVAAQLNLCAISKFIYSLEPMVEVDPQKGEGYEDSIFACLLHHKYGEYEFVPPEGIKCTQFANKSEPVPSTWVKGPNLDFFRIGKTTRSIEKYISENKELPDLKKFIAEGAKLNAEDEKKRKLAKISQIMVKYMNLPPERYEKIRQTLLKSFKVE